MTDHITEQLSHSLGHLKRALSDYNTRLGRNKTTPAQCDLLLQLTEGPVMVKDLASRLNITSGAITQIADQLEAKQLLERFMNEDDRRVVWVKATDIGRKHQRFIIEKHAERMGQIIRSLSKEEAIALQKIISKLQFSNKPVA